MKSKSDFNTETSRLNYKYCQFCNAPIPRHSEETYCPKCRDRVLFMEVRDFIRANDVNEFQVADHFGIPLRIVKEWIREGRIEYKDDGTGKHIVVDNNCSRCGAPVKFGTLCSKCLKLMNRNMQGFGTQQSQEDDRMYYLDNELHHK